MTTSLLYVGTQEASRQILVVCLELRNCLEPWNLCRLLVDLPYITFSLQSAALVSGAQTTHECKTLLFPATKHEPSEAMVTDRIGTSPAGAWFVLIYIRRDVRVPKFTDQIEHTDVL